jgi:hypothetical protein
MASNPVGESCSNCALWIGKTCRGALPSPEFIAGGATQFWAPTDAGAWCVGWSSTPVLGGGLGLIGPAGPAGPKVTSGTAAPSGGTSGDWHVQTAIDISGLGLAFSTTGTMLWLNTGGVWNQLGRFPDV